MTLSRRAGPDSMIAFEPLDLLLLRAALLDAGRARLAWEELARRFDLDTIDHGRARLLPLLHHNLLALGIEDPRLARLRGIRHYHWARNQVRLRRLAPLLQTLEQAGVEVLLLKGAALLASALPDFSLRPMDDIDLLVRPADVGRVLPLLAAANYRPVDVWPWTVHAQLLDELPGYPFANAAGEQIDLHWHALHLDQRPRADEPLWAGARPGQLFGRPARVPQPADLLLHVCAHAAGWNVTHGLRWAADAAIILRTWPELDWDRVLRRAREQRIEASMAPQFAALRHHLDLPIPDGVATALARRSSWLDRRLARAAARAPGERTTMEQRLLALDNLRRRRDYLFDRSLLRALPSHLRAGCPARSRAALLPLLAFRALGSPAALRRRLPLDRWRPALPTALPALGTELHPGSPPAARAAFLEGWSYFETGGRWTLGREARLAWRLAAPAGDLEVVLDGWVFRPPTGQAPRIELWCRGERLAEAEPPARPAPPLAQLRARLPARLLAGPDVTLTLVVERPVTPLGSGYSNDPRPLGFFLRRAWFERPSAAAT